MPSDDDDRVGELLGVNKALHSRAEPVAQRGRKAEVLWCRCLEGCTVNYAPSGAARIRQLATEFDCLIELGECALCSLFDEDHLAHLGDRSGLQAVQIHAAGDVLATMVTAIPMGGVGTRQIRTRRAVAHVDFSD